MPQILGPISNVLWRYTLGVIMAEIGYKRLNLLAKITHGLD